MRVSLEAYRSAEPAHVSSASTSMRMGSKLRAGPDFALLTIVNFFIVTVPMPMTKRARPYLRSPLKALMTVGHALNAGDIVACESTVYPGATEEDSFPSLTKSPALKAGINFSVRYSPERISPVGCEIET
jgi:UDP-N-acetyl-D-glucosamine/UDP-N-acetyl-D-galactosamine dehydrogenase